MCVCVCLWMDEWKTVEKLICNALISVLISSTIYACPWVVDCMIESSGSSVLLSHTNISPEFCFYY